MKETAIKNRPSHTVYMVEGEGENAFWTKIGSAWAHDDHDGFNIALAAVPVNGRLVLRKRKEQGGKGE